MIKLINFVDLTLEEKKMILDWRNNPVVKKWMYNSNDILLDEHLKFIDTLSDIKTKLYFLVKQDKQYIGVIDFTNITNNSCEFGLYSNINLKGFGTLLLEIICNYAFKDLKIKKLKAEVFTENKRAIYLYKKYKFQEIDKKVFNNRELICMELENEDR